ncbi:MAG: PilZ domain-containing protein [Myxococcaceae bacterium]|nr:PilZ domain-containing protein [Myxococcaceae bacterium]
MIRIDLRRTSRSASERPLEVMDIESGIGFRARGLDASEHGLAFHAPMEPALGAQMYVTPGDGSGPQTEIEVVRIERQTTGFVVAATVRRAG